MLKVKFPLPYLAIVIGIVSSCTTQTEKKPTAEMVPNDSSVQDCAMFWAKHQPEDSVKIALLKEVLFQNKSLPSENKRLIQHLIRNLEFGIFPDSLPFIFEKALFPIHRLADTTIGILGYNQQLENNGQWEDLSKEDQVLKGNRAYQSMDSLDRLVRFPLVFSKLFPLEMPITYWFSQNKKQKSNITGLAYWGGECLSYFQYNFVIPPNDTKEKIVLGSPYNLELEFGRDAQASKILQSQYQQNCIDCPSEYDQLQVFAKLKGANNVFFAYADSWPINNKLKSPSRAMVVKDKSGQLITVWYSELDLIGCGCQ